MRKHASPPSILAELEVPGGKGGRETFLNARGTENLTLADVGRLQASSVGAPQIAGTPADIADWLEAAIDEAGGDGFMITLCRAKTRALALTWRFALVRLLCGTR